MAKFVNPLIQSREQAHIFHLTTKSFAAHSALKDYYTSIVGYIDRFVETYAAKHKTLGTFRGSGKLMKDATVPRMIKYFQGLAKTIRSIKTPKAEPWLENIKLEVLELIMNTIYRLQLDGSRKRKTTQNNFQSQ